LEEQMSLEQNTELHLEVVEEYSMPDREEEEEV
jgi:hypothetical protein